jgi:hypothetical protein
MHNRNKEEEIILFDETLQSLLAMRHKERSRLMRAATRVGNDRTKRLHWVFVFDPSECSTEDGQTRGANDERCELRRLPSATTTVQVHVPHCQAASGEEKEIAMMRSQIRSQRRSRSGGHHA